MQMTSNDMPVVLFRDTPICAVIWYPIHPVKPIGYVFEEVIWSDAATYRHKVEAPVWFAKNCGVKLMGWSRKKDAHYFKLLEANNCVKHTGFSDIVFHDQRAKAWESIT